MKYRDDFTYYYFSNEGELSTAASALAVPEDVEEYCKIHDAISYVQKLGCAGFSQHKIQSEYHQLCLEVLKAGVEKYGEIFPILLRGVRENSLPDSAHKILFGTLDHKVAECYGKVTEYQNVKGLRVLSISTVSVTTDDYSVIDEEIIFFPE